MMSLWNKIKDQIKNELPEKSYTLWINPITLIDEKPDTLTLGCPNRFSLNWITENYKAIIESKIRENTEDDHKIVFKVLAPRKKTIVPQMFQKDEQLPLPKIPAAVNNRKKKFRQDFTFDRFVVGNCNEFAYSASKALATGNTCNYDTLFLLSKTGLGKSHLSQAIGNTVLDEKPDIRAYYISAEDFVNEMVFALKNNRIDEFKNRYRHSCDVLMLENVHFLSGKAKMQSELVYTLDALLNDRKKIIFTGSMLPVDIPNITKELSSRLSAGIVTAIEKPDYNTRSKILVKKSAELGMCLYDNIIDLLAQKLTKDVRQIESVIRCLKAKSELMGLKIDADTVESLIRCYVTDDKRISLSTIQDLICQYYKLDPAMLKAKSRKKIHSYPRNIYIYLSRQHTDATLDEIGASVKRNHSTVIYSSEVIERKLKLNNTVKKEVSFLNEKIKESIMN